MTPVAETAEPRLLSRAPLSRSAELANLDVLRALAVGLVFIGHLFGTMRIRGVGDLGHLGVLLFFVHTSLVLMMSMERLRLSGRRLYVAFMVRRIFRIYPLSILCVLVVLIFRIPSTSWGGGFSWPGWRAVFSNLFLAQDLTQSPSVDCVLWSLPFEMQMYAVLPFLFAIYVTGAHPAGIARARAARSIRPLLLLWLAAAALASFEFAFRSIDRDFLLARYAPCFISGVIAWRLLKSRKPVLPSWAWVSFLLALAALYRFTDLVRVYGPGAIHASGNLRNDHLIWWPPWCDLLRDWLFCAATGFAIPFFSEIRAKWLAISGKLIARYSYGIYVSHVPILWLSFTLLPGPIIARAAVACLATVLVSVAAFALIESPAIELGKKAASAFVNRMPLPEYYI